MSELRFHLCPKIDEDDRYTCFMFQGESLAPDRVMIRDWCREHLGKQITSGRQDGVWTDFHGVGPWMISIIDKNAAFAFRMRWC